MRYRVYLDTEYCYPGMRKGTPRPTAADKRQIVQIAAIVYDTEEHREVAAFNQLVTPIFMPTLPGFFTELTGITQAQVDTGSTSFEAAYEQFFTFCREYPIWTFDKDEDEEVLRQNCEYLNLKWLFRDPFIRVKAMLAGWGINPNDYSSGTLYKAANLNMHGHVHDALHDVRSMAAAIAVFEKY